MFARCRSPGTRAASARPRAASPGAWARRRAAARTRAVRSARPRGRRRGREGGSVGRSWKCAEYRARDQAAGDRREGRDSWPMPKDRRATTRGLWRASSPSTSSRSRRRARASAPRAAADAGRRRAVARRPARDARERRAVRVAVAPAEARSRPRKRALLRLLRIVTRDQTVFNSALLEARADGTPGDRGRFGAHVRGGRGRRAGRCAGGPRRPPSAVGTEGLRDSPRAVAAPRASRA